MTRHTQHSRTAMARVVSIEHPLRALVVAALLAAATHLGLGAIDGQNRSDGESASVTVTHDDAPGAVVTGLLLSRI